MSIEHVQDDLILKISGEQTTRSEEELLKHLELCLECGQFLSDLEHLKSIFHASSSGQTYPSGRIPFFHKRVADKWYRISGRRVAAIPRWRTRFGWMAAVAVLAVVLIFNKGPDPQQAILADLPILENLDLLENMEILEELDAIEAL